MMRFQDLPTDWAGKWAEYSSERIAFREFETDRTFTFGELDKLGNQLCKWLISEKGIQKGDRVAVLAENCLEMILLFVAAQKMGIILVPLNYRLTGSELAYLLKTAAPGLLIVEESYEEKVPQTTNPVFETISLGFFREIISGLDAEVGGFVPDRREEDETLFILFTSGSTGFPKGVKYTHGMMFWNSINTAFSIKVNSDSRTVNCMPLFHTGGWNVLLTPFLHHGGYTCIMKKFDAAAVLNLLKREKATIFMGVPTMMKMMADLPEFEQANFPNLYYCLVGGEAMPVPLIERWNAKGVPIRQGYGMTECGPNLTSLHHHDAIERAGSIGRPNFFIQTRIVDEKGQDCGFDEPGELWIRGPVVTPGYWENPEATAETIEDGWLKTGDRVVRREGGFLYVVDRIKNMFISGGENVYPAEIERVLSGHPAVSEVVVIGVADDRWGEVGKAFVVRVGVEKADAEGLKLHCLEHLAKYKVPRHFVFVDALPKGDTGKIDRKALR